VIFISSNKKLATLSVFVLIPLLVGYLAGFFTSDSMMLYSQLNKPPISPPGYIFPIVWTILYVLMGISSHIIYESNSPNSKKVLKVYVFQLILNFLWSIIFFGFNNFVLAFVWILFLILVIIYMIYEFSKISKIAALLQIPYLLWCIFAAYLNFMIIILN